MCKITISDAYVLQYCTSGAKAFADKYNLNWKLFLTEGVESDVLEATGDHFAIKLVNYCKGKENGR